MTTQIIYDTNATSGNPLVFIGEETGMAYQPENPITPRVCTGTPPTGKPTDRYCNSCHRKVDTNHHSGTPRAATCDDYPDGCPMLDWGVSGCECEDLAEDIAYYRRGCRYRSSFET